MKTFMTVSIITVGLAVGSFTYAMDAVDFSRINSIRSQSDMITVSPDTTAATPLQADAFTAINSLRNARDQVVVKDTASNPTSNTPIRNDLTNININNNR